MGTLCTGMEKSSRNNLNRTKDTLILYGPQFESEVHISMFKTTDGPQLSVVQLNYFSTLGWYKSNIHSVENG